MDCVVEYQKSPHLNIIYSGLIELDKKGIVNIEFKYGCKPVLNGKPILKMRFSNKIILFDTLDGFNWINGSMEDNLDFFKKEIEYDYYFKRSYKPDLKSSLKENKVYPLGLYYYLNYPEIDNINYPNKISRNLRSIGLIRNLLGKASNNYPIETFESPPNFINGFSKVIYSVRLWNPESAKSEESREQRLKMNHFRIKCTEICKSELGEYFVGGISRDKFSEKTVPSNLLVPLSFSKRDNYLRLVKKSTIGVATTGLHDSIGGKLAEYVASSKAIISEKLHFTVSGNFKKNQNYLEFLTEEDLLSNIDLLLSNRSMLFDMMKSNHRYYHQFLRPDMLVLNALHKVVEDY